MTISILASRASPALPQSVFMLVSLLLACSQPDTNGFVTDPPAEPHPPTLPAVVLRISTDQVGLLVNAATSLTAGAYDAEGNPINLKLEWASADPAIATVDKSGMVTAVADGNTTITVTSSPLTSAPLSASVPVSVIAVAGTIAFTRQSRSYGALNFDVFAYSNGSARPVTRASQFTSIAAPAWSPDGSLLAVEVIHTVTNDDINHVYSYASDVVVLSGNAPPESAWRALTSDGRSRSPSWSPDGSRLAYVQGSMAYDADHTANHVYVVDIASGEATRLTQTAGYYSTARWSPDGTRLTFANGGDVFITNADGSGLFNVTRSAAYDDEPSWSPDGARLVFVSRIAVGMTELIIVDVDGTNHRRLTTGETYSGPVWSPDGRYVAFAQAAAQNIPIYVVRADGSIPVQVSYPPLFAWDYAPAWKH